MSVDGNDIETTIDVSMQDAAEKALLKQLKNINGDVVARWDTPSLPLKMES